MSEKRSWRCYHCDEIFYDDRSARTHFGSDESCKPGCIIASETGLLEALRVSERANEEAWSKIHSESTESAQAYHAQQSRHQTQLRAVEEAGYALGLRDAKLDLDHTKGLETALGNAAHQLVGMAEALEKNFPSPEFGGGTAAQLRQWARKAKTNLAVSYVNVDIGDRVKLKGSERSGKVDVLIGSNSQELAMIIWDEGCTVSAVPLKDLEYI